MRKTTLLRALVALFLLPGATIAQMSPGARSVAMGGGGMVFATGVDAVEWNPANLGWGGGWNISLYEAGFSTLGSGAAFKDMLAVFGAEAPRFLSFLTTDRTVPQIIDGLPAGGFQFSSVTEGYLTAYGTRQAEIPQPGSPLPSIGIAVGPIGVRVRSRVLMNASISRDLADLIGNGFVEQNIQNYSVGNTGWSTTSFSEVTVAYGTTLGGLLSVGVGGRYVMGHGMVSGRFFEPDIDLNNLTMTVQSVAVEATSGTGYGLDVGLSLELPAGFRASASGTNVVQRMTWDEGLVAHSATYAESDFDSNVDFIDLLDRYDAQPITPNSVSLEVFEASQGLFEESYFPQVFRAGLGWRSGGTSLEAVGIQVAPRGRYTSAWDERLSVGIEQKIPLLTLRAGMTRASDGLGAITAGGGLGLGPVQLEVSGGKFSGDGSTTVWDGYYGTVALQIKGGGS
ncbi:MAG: hypothetical protein O2958_02305 [Gemmatimonadetes bacterium]|nr:hypothetical protein [Gemmatimonadota bacterium]MDA1102060.1 hypothetical protein [Gemmatimonadota bacterium]